MLKYCEDKCFQLNYVFLGISIKSAVKSFQINYLSGNACPLTLIHFLALKKIQSNVSLIIATGSLPYSPTTTARGPLTVRGRWLYVSYLVCQELLSVIFKQN